MSTRYVTNAMIALLGVLIIVVSQALAPGAVAWIAFGVAIAVVAVSLLVQVDRHRGLAQRGLDGALTAIGATLIALSLVFGGATVVWLAFALGLGFLGVGFGGMTLHEIERWRSEHQLGQLRWLAPVAEEPEKHELAQMSHSRAA